MVSVRLLCIALATVPGTLGAIVDLPAAIIGRTMYHFSWEQPRYRLFKAEAKIQIPYVARIGSSPSKPFLFKRRIMVDNAINVAGSWIAFGLNTTLNKFIPANSSDSLSYDYEVEGVLKAKIQPATSGSIPLSSFREAAGLPWFAEFVTCAQHFYNFTNPVQRLSGKSWTVELAEGITVPVEGIHTTVPFKIVERLDRYPVLLLVPQQQVDITQYRAVEDAANESLSHASPFCPIRPPDHVYHEGCSTPQRPFAPLSSEPLSRTSRSSASAHYTMPRHSSTTTVDTAVAEQLKAFNDNVTKRAEEIVFKVFPQKILWVPLHRSQETHLVFHRWHHRYHCLFAPTEPEPPTKKRRHENGDSVTMGSVVELGEGGPRFVGRVVANHRLRALHDDLKNEYMELVNLCDKVKLWVNLTMPKIEDGDNFGVQIQEEVLNELHRAQDSGYNLRDAVSKSHHINRAKICSKILKYPHVEDYAIALQEHDEKQFYMALRNLIDLRNIYAVLTDVIHKNFQKIRAPKGNNGAAMPWSSQPSPFKRAKKDEIDESEITIIDDGLSSILDTSSEAEEELPPPVHDPEYYYEDGSIVFRVGDVLFKVHTSLLKKETSDFEKTFDVPPKLPDAVKARGTCDENPIIIPRHYVDPLVPDASVWQQVEEWARPKLGQLVRISAKAISEGADEASKANASDEDEGEKQGDEVAGGDNDTNVIGNGAKSNNLTDGTQDPSRGEPEVTGGANNTDHTGGPTDATMSNPAPTLNNANNSIQPNNTNNANDVGGTDDTNKGDATQDRTNSPESPRSGGLEDSDEENDSDEEMRDGDSESRILLPPEEKENPTFQLMDALLYAESVSDTSLHYDVRNVLQHHCLYPETHHIDTIVGLFRVACLQEKDPSMFGFLFIILLCQGNQTWKQDIFTRMDRMAFFSAQSYLTPFPDSLKTFVSVPLFTKPISAKSFATIFSGATTNKSCIEQCYTNAFTCWQETFDDTYYTDWTWLRSFQGRGANTSVIGSYLARLTEIFKAYMPG
ncbi:Proteasome activator pa28, REG alpha beta subunit [Rhizoctonia solani]|uniref:Proteasome activator pa28, REG alpha beta subunit n=1 Tax=Rhizoctonia solani TaxID=456999 RepID=A0A8H7ID36_9AGAM|nr:Proteasome activator pa28, REG alpha beta subunit [Rhizoctonia solani]